MKDKIKSVFFMPNGNTVCFNEQGEQVAELQESWFLMWVKYAESMGYNTGDLKEIRLPGGNAELLTYHNEGKKSFNWNI